jgi:hypothetical protein
VCAVACSSTNNTEDASVDADAGCDPRDASVDDAPSSDSSATTDSGQIDLDSGSSNNPGHFICYVDLGGDARVSNCTGSLTCCDLKDECYDPAQEPNFCLRPYCQ